MFPDMQCNICIYTYICNICMYLYICGKYIPWMCKFCITPDSLCPFWPDLKFTSAISTETISRRRRLHSDKSSFLGMAVLTELKPWLSMPFPSPGVPELSLSAWRCWELWELLLNSAEVAEELRLGCWVPCSLSWRPSAGHFAALRRGVPFC